MYKQINLEQLCQPLNVDMTTDEIIQDHEQLTQDIETLRDQLADVTSDLKDYKDQYEELQENLRDFKQWLTIQFDNHDYVSISSCIDDIGHEFKKTFKAYL